MDELIWIKLISCIDNTEESETWFSRMIVFMHLVKNLSFSMIMKFICWNELAVERKEYQDHTSSFFLIRSKQRATYSAGFSLSDIFDSCLHSALSGLESSCFGVQHVQNRPMGRNWYFIEIIQRTRKIQLLEIHARVPLSHFVLSSRKSKY